MKPAAGRFQPGALAAILAAGALARLLALLSLRGDLAIRVPLSDAEQYLMTATRLAGGEGWPPGPFFLAPIYPFLLSGLFRVAPAGVETVQWVQLALGLATTALVFLAAHRIDPKSAPVAGLLYALCGPAIAFENLVLMETLLAFCLTAVIWFAGDPARFRGFSFGFAGLAAGLATAGRPIYLLLLPLLLVLAARSGRHGRLWSRPVWLTLVAFALVVLPPSLHNYRATGQPSFVTVSGGLNLYIGNNPAARGLYTRPPGLLYLDQDPTGARSASRMAGRPLDAAGASRFFARQAWSYLAAHPVDAAALLVRKAGYLISPDEIPQIESLAGLAQRHPILLILGLVGFPLLFPLALLGAWTGRGDRRTRALCLGVLLAGALVHLIFFSTGRYRVALLPALAVLAGVGLAALLREITSRGRTWRRLWPLAAGLLLLILAPRYERQAAAAWAYHQSGIRYDRLGAPRAAAEMYRQALEASPSQGESWHNLAATKARQGRTVEALDDYEQALRFLGDHPLTLYNMAVLYGRLGMDERALEQLDRSIAADPNNAAVRVDRGVALYRLGRSQEAFAAWRKVAREAPGEPSLRRTLGQLAAMGAELPDDLRAFAQTP